MPDEIDDLLDSLAAPKPQQPRRARPTKSHLDVLTKFAQDNKLTVGSTTGGRHNRGSLHYSGNAIDIKGSGAFDDATVQRLAREAQARGLKLRDERRRPAGQKVWGGPHIHVEYAGVGDDYDALLDSIASPTTGAPPIQPQFPSGTTKGVATGRAELVRRPNQFPRGTTKGTASGRADLIGQRPPPISIADLRQRDEAAIQAADANRRAVRAQVERERMTNAPAPARLLAKGVRMFGPQGVPVLTAARELTTGEGDLVNEEVERRLAEQRLAETPEVVEGRREFGAQAAPVRALTMPAGRAGAGLLKTLAGLSAFGGIAPNEASEYLNKRAAVLEQAASLAPLDTQGQEIDRWKAEKAGGAVLDVGFTVAQLMAMKRATGLSLSKIMMLETALRTSDQPMKERAAQVAQAGVMGRALDTQMSRVGGAAANVVPTLAQEVPAVAAGQRDPSDAAINTLVQAGTGALLTSPRRAPQLQPMPEVTTREAAPVLRPSDLQRRVALRGERRETTTETPETIAGQARGVRSIDAELPRADVAREAVRLREQAAPQPTTSRAVVPEARGVSRETQTETQPPVQARAEGGKLQVESKTVPVFHGTSKESAAKIKSEGFQFGRSEGMASEPIGDFVFVTPSRRSADWYAKNNLRIKDGDVVEGGFSGNVYRTQRPTTEYGAMAELAEKLGQKLTGERIVDTKDLAERMRANDISAIAFKDRNSNREAWAVLPDKVTTNRGMNVESVKPQWQHRDFGRVQESDNQSGVGRGRVRVTAEDGSEHVIQRANLRGQGNNLAVPVRETAPTEAPAAEGGQKPPMTTAELDGKTYTRRGSEWYRDSDGRRVAGITKDRLNAASRQGGPTEPAAPPPAAVKPAQRPSTEAASQAETASAPATALEMNREQFIRYTDSVIQNLAERHGKGFAQKYKQATSRLFPAGDVAEYRYAGVVTKSGDKFLLNVLADTDSPAAKWRVADTIDVTDQFASATSPAPKSAPPIKPPPVEPAKAPEPKLPETTSVKNAATAELRRDLELLELEGPEKKSWQTTIDNALAKGLDKKAEEIAERVVRSERREGLSDEEAAGVQHRLRELENEWQNRYNADPADPKLRDLKQRIANLTKATNEGGTAPARALNFRRSAIDKEFNLINMVMKAEEAKGRELRPEEFTRYEKMASQIKSLTEQLAVAQEKAQTTQLQRQIDRVKRQTRRGETKQVLDEEFAALKAQFATAKIETRSGVQSSGLAGLDPEGKLTVLIAKMARNRVKAGVVEAEKLVDEVYGAIKDKVEGLRREDVRDSILAYGFAEGRERTRQTQLLKQESEFGRRLAEKDYTRVERTPPVYTRETYAIQKRVDELKAQFQRELYRAERGRGGLVADTALSIANIPKTGLTIGDLSAMGRQAGIGFYQHPILSARAAGDMFRSFTQHGFANVVNAIKAHPDFQTLKRAGVQFTGVDKTDPKLSHREEGYFGSEAIDLLARGKYNLPGKAAKAVKDFSERTFVSMLDSQRLRIGAHQLEALRGMNLGRKGLQDAINAQAKYINIITGRGNLGRWGNQAAPLLNIFGFSPRLVVSRFQFLNKMFNPVAWANMPKGARKLQMISNAKFLFGVASTLALIKAAGDQYPQLGISVNMDSEDDADFLKVKVGNARYDFLTGLQQPMRFLLRMAVSGGEQWGGAMRGGETYTGAGADTITADFLRSKAAPLVGYGWDALAGKNRLTGKKFEAGKDLAKTVIPLPFQDFQEAVEQDGAVRGIAEALPSLFGVGVQTYPLSPEKAVTHAEKLARRIIRDNLPETARTEEEMEKSRKASDLRARSRRGEDVTAEIPALNLTERQTKSIVEAKGVPRFQEDVKRLGVEDVLRVWRVASPAERAIIKPLLADKADAVDQLDPSKQDAVKAQLRAIGIVPVEELPAEKQREIVGRRRLESREQSRARREKQRAQGRQRPSLGYGYN